MKKNTNRRARRGLLLLTVLAACSAPESDNDQPSAITQNPQQLRAALLNAMFPDSASNDAILCRLDPTKSHCQADLNHLSAVPSTAGAPSVSACQQARGSQISGCDGYARHLLMRGLNEGDLSLFLQGATRLKHLMNMPQMPPYYRLGSPNNIFEAWLGQFGVEMSQLNTCIDGSEDDIYFCLTENPNAPNRETIKGLLDALEHHNGVLARNGHLSGASARQEAILRSIGAPLMSSAARTEQFAPNGGPGVQNISAVANLFGLRLLEGLPSASSTTEVEYLINLDSYRPPGTTDAFYKAPLTIMAAQSNAFRWSDISESVITIDRSVAQEFNIVSIALQRIAETASALGDATLAEQVLEVKLFIAENKLIGNRFGILLGVGSPTQRIFTPYLLSLAIIRDNFEALYGDVARTCGMHEKLVAYTEERTVVYDNVVEGVRDCTPDAPYESGVVIRCKCTDPDFIAATGSGGMNDHIDWDQYDQENRRNTDPPDLRCSEWTLVWREQVTYTDEWTGWHDFEQQLDVAHNVTVETIAVRLAQRRIYESYHALLNSNDNDNHLLEDSEVYRHPASGNPVDLHLHKDSHPTILNAGVWASACLDEIKDTSNNYRGIDPGPMDCTGLDPRVDVDCTERNLTTLGGRAARILPQHFLPYSIAQRICPNYVAQINGVLDPDFSLSLKNCTTPWGYTQAVQYFIENEVFDRFGYSNYTSEVKKLKDVVLDFAAEAIHLTQPVSAGFARQADLASVAGNAAVSTSASPESVTQWYADNIGTDRIRENFQTGEFIMRRGFDLVNAFNNLEISREAAPVYMTRLWKDAYDKCTASNCVANTQDHLRALFYRRLRDATQTYFDVSRGAFEINWRGLDGNRCYDTDGDGSANNCASCLVGDDTDNDGTPDTYKCAYDGDLDGDNIVDVQGCELRCPAYAATFDIADFGTTTMQNVSQMLRDHNLQDNVSSIKAFLDASSAYAMDIGVQLNTNIDRLHSAQDWLGFKTDLSFPGVNLEPNEIENTTDQLYQDLATFADNAAANIHSAFIDQFVLDITQLRDFASKLSDLSTTWAGTIDDYCNGGPAACRSEWKDAGNPDSGYALIDRINTQLERQVCNRTIQLHYYSANGPVPMDAVPLLPDGVDCPRFSSPDFSAFADASGQPYLGKLPALGLEIEAALLEIEIWISEVSKRIDEIQSLDKQRVSLAEDQRTLNDKEETRSQIRDWTGCGLAIVQGISTLVGVNPGSAKIPAGVEACARIIEREINKGDPTEAELEYAYQMHAFEVQASNELLSLDAQINDLIRIAQRYRILHQRYLSLNAEFDRALVYQDRAFDALLNSPVFDPTMQMFTDQTLAQMVANFRDLARRARELALLVSYDVGSPVLEGSDYHTFGGTHYYLPPLSQVTVYSSQGRVFEDAAALLQMNGPSLPPEFQWNLVSYASVLQKLHQHVTESVGDRKTTGPIRAGNGTVGLVDTAGDRANPGEAAMLGDSPFYDPFKNADDPNDTSLGITCVAGQIDMHDYCSFYTDATTGALTTTAVADGTCVSVTAMSDRVRYDLAHLDHLIRGIGVETFECLEGAETCVNYNSETAECDEIQQTDGALRASKALDIDGDGAFDDDELLGTQGGQPEYYDPLYFAAQTPTVRRLFTRVAVEAANSPWLGSSQVDLDQGNYLFLLDMSNANPLVNTAAGFDPEISILDASAVPLDPSGSMAEQLQSVALVCLSEFYCPGTSSHFAQVVALGPGYLGNRCVLTSTSARQERIRFDLEPEDFPGVPAVKITSSNLETQVRTLLEAPSTVDLFSPVPLHTNGWLISLDGHGQAPDFSWPLYESTETSPGGPRIVPYFQYSYYGTAQKNTPYAEVGNGMMQCFSAAGQACSVPTCQ